MTRTRTSNDLRGSLLRMTCLTACLLAVATAGAAQTTPGQPSTTQAQASASPTPEAADVQPSVEGRAVKSGNYSIISSIEAGVRGVSVAGNDDK